MAANQDHASLNLARHSARIAQMEERQREELEAVRSKRTPSTKLSNKCAPTDGGVMFEIELGVKVVSNTTGFKGVVTSRSEHLNGCNRYWVQPPCDKDGKLVDGAWHDENELIVKAGRRLPQKNQDRGGFPSRIK